MLLFAGNLPKFSCTCSAGVDLNRDFPDIVHLRGQDLGPQGTEQPETLALMQWLTDTHFTASAVMHEVGLDVSMAAHSGSGAALARHQPRRLALPSLQLLEPLAGLSKHASGPNTFCLAHQISPPDLVPLGVWAGPG